MSAWPTKPLAELSTRIDYGYTASASTENVGPKFLRITDIVSQHLDWRAVPQCEIDTDKVEKYALEEGDIVIARTGATVGYAKYISNPPPSVFASYLVRVRIDRSESARYIGLVVESTEYKNFVATNAGGSAQPNANAKVLTSFPVPLPPKPIQNKIVAAVAGYDDLVESNRQRIEVLEQMAQVVYRHHLSSLRADLVPLHSIAETARVNVNPAKHPTEVFDHFSFSAFDDEQLPQRHVGSELKAGKFLVPEASVLLAKLNPRIPRVWLAEPAGEHRSIASSEFLVLRPRGAVPLEYLFLAMKSDEFRNRLIGLATGTSTSHQRVKPEDLKRLDVVLPEPDVLTAFAENVRPILKLARNLRRTNRNLKQTRNLLLPKFISGQIDISDVDIDTSWLAA